MTPKVRDFVETHQKKSKPSTTIFEWMEDSNHEIWRKCPKCGAFEDLRKTTHCTQCHAKLD